MSSPVFLGLPSAMKKYGSSSVLRSLLSGNSRRVILVLSFLSSVICCAFLFSTRAAMQAGNPPVGVSDSYSGLNARHQDAPGVLANDVYLDRSMMYASVNTNPQYGVLSMSQDGSFGYTPNQYYPGTDSFSYYSCAYGVAGCTTATVTLVDANTAPVASDDFSAFTPSIDKRYCPRPDSRNRYSIEKATRL